MLVVSLAVTICSVVIADQPAAGTLATTHVEVTDDGLEEKSGISTRDYVITYPLNAAAGQTYPLLVFAHGAAGGRIDMLAYQTHFNDLAAYGFVVIAPKSCFMGCSPPANATTLASTGSCLPWTDGPQWTSFVFENTRAIDYAKASSEVWATLIDWSAGIGVAGHSMGGEVVSQMGSSQFAEQYQVKAVVCEHCQMCEVDGTAIATPAMFMTGTGDYEVMPRQVKGAYTEDSAAPKSFRNEKGRGHMEMLNLLVQYNPAVASHVAAFFKVHVSGDTDVYYKQVYGDGADSFCNYADMYECMHDMGDALV